MKKILLCSPFYPNKEHTTCGLANWTRNLLSCSNELDNEFQIDLLPFDRSVDLDEESPAWERLYSGILDYIKLVYQAKKRIQHTEYSIVQVSTSASIGLIKDILLAKLAKRKGAKIIFHFHFGRMPEVLEKNNWETKLMKSVLAMASAVIVMDMSSYKALQTHGYTNVHYLPNPLADSNFQKIKLMDGTVNRVKNQILFVGHVVEPKGVYELVTACSRIEDVTLRIVGKVFANTKTALEKIAATRDRGKWMTFVGEIPHDDVLIEMCKCDMFVLPTYTEGFPNVILESMATGAPTIASAVGAIPEMLNIGQEECGICIEPKNVDQVVSSIKKLQKDNDYKKSISDRAKCRVEEMYNVSSVRSKLNKIWKETMTIK